MKKRLFQAFLIVLCLAIVLLFAVGVIAVVSSDGNVGFYLSITIPVAVVLLLISFVFSMVYSKRFTLRVRKQMDAVSNSLKCLNAGEFQPLQERVGDATFERLFKEINILNESTYSAMLNEKQIAEKKSDFFANASHELKTPLTTMCGMSEILLQDERLDERQKKQIERIHKECVRLSDLIRDMLEISNLERGGVQDECTNIRLESVVEEVLNELAPQAQKKGLHVETIGQGEIFANGKKIYEVVQNLCSNAIHYNKEGGWIRVEIVEEDRAVFLIVEDGGIGIEEKHLPRIYERFYRVDKSHSKSTGGTGLGLAIVKHVCALYGAKISIESEPGKGTKFTVRFKK